MMTVIAVKLHPISLKIKHHRNATIAWTGLIASFLTIILLAWRSQVHDNARVGVTMSMPPAALIAATSGGAEAVVAVGERAKRINASLPFDLGPIPAAKPFIIGLDRADYPRALLCLRAAVYHEAGFEPMAGRRAVAQVILNRTHHPAFPKSVCDVVYQGSHSPVCQFSFACDEARYRPVAANAWAEAEQVAANALAGSVEAPVGMATHYHADYVAPRWAPLLTKITRVGTHIFYRWPGPWGEPRAFLRRYLGEDASGMGRALELDAAAKATLQIAGARGVALLGVQEGKIVGELARGDILSAPAAPSVWDVGAYEDLIAATLVGRLVEQGLVSWETPMEELFPDVLPSMGQELASITLAQLLFDPSVLKSKYKLGPAINLAEGLDEVSVQRATFLKNAISTVAEKRKSNRPRTPGIVIAMAAVEELTKRSYEDLIRDELARPLGLRTVGVVSRASSIKTSEDAPEGSLRPLAQPGAMHIGLRDFVTILNDQRQGAKGKGKLLSEATYRRIQKFSAQPLAYVPNKTEDCSSQQFRALVNEGDASYLVAGVNMGPKGGRALVISGVLPGHNRLSAFTRTMKSQLLSGATTSPRSGTASCSVQTRRKPT